MLSLLKINADDSEDVFFVVAEFGKALGAGNQLNGTGALFHCKQHIYI
jgi:hypothetical protein